MAAIVPECTINFAREFSLPFGVPPALLTFSVSTT